MKADPEDFIGWLQAEYGLQANSARDWPSRVQRAFRLVGQLNNESRQLAALEENSEFRALTTGVKSQLRRAVRLHWLYERAQKKR